MIARFRKQSYRWSPLSVVLTILLGAVTLSDAVSRAPASRPAFPTGERPAMSWGTDCRFFRIQCVDGEAPENLAITSDEFGQTFLEFDTVEGYTYVIESTDSFAPPAWTAVWTLPGDGLRASWLTTRRWSRTFGGERGDEAYSVELSPDGGYIVAGSTNSFGTEPSWGYLFKTDADGNQVWARTFGGYTTGDAKCVRQTSDGGYVVAGSVGTNSTRRDDVILVKTDSEGNEVWSRTFGGTGSDYANSVQQTSDGGYIIAGYTTASGSGDAYLIKTDAEGYEVWSHTFGGTDTDRAWCVQQTSDGGYILAGGTRSFGASVGYRPDAYLIKTDSDGNEVWSRTFGGGNLDVAYCVQQTSDGGYIVAGLTASFGEGNSDIYLVKTDPNGETGQGKGWTKILDNNGNDQADSVRQTSDGGYIVAGHTIDSFSYDDVYLLKTDSGGNEVWSQTFGGSSTDMAYAVQETPDGGYIAAGLTASFGAGGRDVFLIKTDLLGNAPPLE